jgi:hypothetical protein
MALVYCAKCGHRVSTTMPRCLGCGAPGPATVSQTKRTWARAAHNASPVYCTKCGQNVSARPCICSVWASGALKLPTSLLMQLTSDDDRRHLLQMGLLVEEGDGYVCALDYRRGVLFVNGRREM